MENSNNRSSSRLKDRLARMFRPASLLRSSCNPSTSSSSAAAAAVIAANPTSANTSSRALLSDGVAHEPAFVASSRRHDGQLTGAAVARTQSFSTAYQPRRRVSAARLSVDLRNCSWPSGHRNITPLPPAAKNQKKERRVREDGQFYEAVGGDGEGRTCPPVSPSSPSTKKSHHSFHYLNGAKESKKSKKLASNAYGFTSSSSSDDRESDVDGGGGFFSSDDEERTVEKEETETFFSSARSFSSDVSSDFYTKHHKPSKNKKPRSKSGCHENDDELSKQLTPPPPRPPPRRSRRRRRAASSCNSCTVKDGFRPLVSVACTTSDKKATPAKDAAARKGFAVVKRSSDPYADFRTSMVEMIIERQIFGAPELERLLGSYLSLNAPRHHPVILQAFSDIWVVLFGG